MKKQMITLLLFAISFAVSAQNSTVEQEALYYIKKAYSHRNDADKTLALKYLKTFEDYLSANLKPEQVGDSIAYYYGTTLGELTSTNDKESLFRWDNVYKYLIRFAEQGDLSSMVAVGISCTHSNNRADAEKWYLKAAEQGYAIAQYRLGVFYFAEKEYNLAKQWLLKADAQNDIGAPFILGLIYGNGLGVSKDDRKAVKYFQKGARRGSTLAQYILEETGEKW